MSNQYTGTIGTYQNGFGGGGGGGSGTVTNVSVISANGLSGNVANPTTTPAITLSTTVTGIVKGNGTTLSAAIAADFPTLNQNTTGNAATATNVQNGTANAIVYQTAASTTGFSKNTGGQAVLAQANGGAPFWQSFGSELPFDLSQYDNNKNLNANNFISSLVTQETTGSNLSLTLNSPKIINFTGTLTNNVILPDATGGIGEAQAGLTYTIINNASSDIVIKDAANNVLLDLKPFEDTTVTLITTGTVDGTWYLTQPTSTVNTAINLAGGSAGEIPYQTASGVTSFIAAGIAGEVLTAQGANEPVWTITTTTPTQQGIPKWDDNYNLSANNFLDGALFYQFATGENAYQLTVTSPKIIFLTSVDYLFARLLIMPNPATISAGFSFCIIDNTYGRTVPIVYNSEGPTTSILPNENFLDKNTCVQMLWNGTTWNCTTNREAAINSLNTPTVFNLTQLDKRTQIFALNTTPAQVVNIDNANNFQNGTFFNLQNLTTANTITINYNTSDIYLLLPNSTIDFYVINGLWEPVLPLALQNPFRSSTISTNILLSDGVLNVDASSASITLTLPEISTLTYYYGQKTWQIRRLDNSNNTVTVQVANGSGNIIFM